jgi:hypothetical protein
MFELVLLIGALVAVLALSVVLVRLLIDALSRLVRLKRSVTLILEGKWGQARVVNESLARGWMSVLPGTRDAAAYNKALCLHMEGDFKASLAELVRFRGRALDRNLRHEVHWLEAANLVLENGEPARAMAALADLLNDRDNPETVLLLVHAKLQVGATAEAAELVARAPAPSSPRIRLGRTLAVGGRKINETIFYALRALYHAKIGDAQRAADDAELALRSQLECVYTERVRALITRDVVVPADRL